MVKSSKGFRSRSRGTFTKKVRERGLPTMTRYMRTFEIGDRVVVDLEPSDPHGQPHPRYQGRVCTVLEKVGRSYRVGFTDGGKAKQLLAAPVHLRPSPAHAPPAPRVEAA